MKFRIVLTKPVGHIIIDSEKKEKIKFEFFQNGMVHYFSGENLPETLDQHSIYSQLKYLIIGYMKREISDIMVENG